MRDAVASASEMPDEKLLNFFCLTRDRALNDQPAFVELMEQVEGLIYSKMPEGGTWDGHLRDFRSGGGTFWVAARHPISTNFKSLPTLSDIADKGEYTLIGGSLTYQIHNTVTTGDATTPLMSANMAGAWIGLEKDAPKYRLGVEGGYTRTTATDSALSKYDVKGTRWQVSGSYEVEKTT